MTEGVLREAADALTTIQGYVLEDNYLSQSGRLAANLASKPYVILTSTSGAMLKVNYLSYMRFLDLKETRKGKKKKRYAPIYNKYVFGFMMGFTYNRLRAGLTNIIYKELTPDRGQSEASINIKL